MYGTTTSEIHRNDLFSFFVLNKTVKYVIAYHSLIPLCDVIYNYNTQREKAIRITEELGRRKDSLKELELKVPKIPEHLRSLTVFRYSHFTRFRYRILILVHFALSRTSLVPYL
jgi:hypothetical protein